MFASDDGHSAEFRGRSGRVDKLQSIDVGLVLHTYMPEVGTAHVQFC